MKHLMIDIETMGNSSYSAIVSIAAVEFDISTGKTGKQFYETIDLQSCIDIGLEMSASTVLWWLRQDSESKVDLLCRNNISIEEALTKLSNFCDKDYFVWGNSVSFDCVILRNAYQKLKMETPWGFWNERCVRTLLSFYPEAKSLVKENTCEHNALKDCLFQIDYCSLAWSKLNKTK